MTTITPRFLAYTSIVLGSIVLLSTIAIILFPKQITNIDQRFARKSKDTPWKMKLALFINHAISPVNVTLFYGLIGALLLYWERYRILGIGVSSIIISSIGFWTVKRITQRERPADAKIKFKDYSFPSGHTTAGFVFFLTLAIALSRVIGLEYRELFFSLALLWGIIVAWSRRYLKVHRVSDVIIGSLLGSGCFLLSYLLFFYFWDAIIFSIEEVFFSL